MRYTDTGCIECCELCDAADRADARRDAGLQPELPFGFRHLQPDGLSLSKTVLIAVPNRASDSVQLATTVQFDDRLKMYKAITLHGEVVRINEEAASHVFVKMLPDSRARVSVSVQPQSVTDSITSDQSSEKRKKRSNGDVASNACRGSKKRAKTQTKKELKHAKVLKCVEMVVNANFAKYKQFPAEYLLQSVISSVEDHLDCSLPFSMNTVVLDKITMLLPVNAQTIDSDDDADGFAPLTSAEHAEYDQEVCAKCNRNEPLRFDPIAADARSPGNVAWIICDGCDREYHCVCANVLSSDWYFNVAASCKWYCELCR